MRKPQSAALEAIFADALLDHEGTTVGALGSQRFGKSYFLKKVLARGFELEVWKRAFVHDVKRVNDPQYEGEVVHSLAEALADAHRLDLHPVTVFVKEAWNRKPSLQEVCELAITVGESGEPVVVLADEVFHGTNGSRIWLPLKSEGGDKTEPLFPWLMREGSSQRLSTAWTTQMPVILPQETRVLTKNVAIFQLEGDAADTACEMFRLSPVEESRKIIENLERGQFLLFRQGKRWDRTIYGPE